LRALRHFLGLNGVELHEMYAQGKAWGLTAEQVDDTSWLQKASGLGPPEPKKIPTSSPTPPFRSCMVDQKTAFQILEKHNLENRIRALEVSQSAEAAEC
jgi:hypothetical protein